MVNDIRLKVMCFVPFALIFDSKDKPSTEPSFFSNSHLAILVFIAILISRNLFHVLYKGNFFLCKYAPSCNDRCRMF